jgi:Protein of unknown function (DUF3237)
MIQLEYEMTYWERIVGPLASTKSSPLGERICWEVAEATLTGPRINAKLAFPGTDWMRLGSDGIRRPDCRVQLITEEGSTILFYYDVAIIKASEGFLAALQNGQATEFSAQYMRMSPQFETGDEKYAWLQQHLFIAEGRLSGKKEIEYKIYRVL